MGNPKPLHIAIDIRYQTEPWAIELERKGHTISWVSDDFDLILGPTCARVLPGMEKFLDSFIKGARMVKYPRKKDDQDDQKRV